MKHFLLHLGVHKTGSTHLQHTFQENSSLLASAGIWTMPTRKYRKLSTFQYVVKRRGNKNKKKTGKEFYREIFEKHDKALASDENILGSMYQFSGGLPYPQAGKRLKKLLEIVGPEQSVQIFVSLRSYADWIESVYLHTIKRAKHVKPFDEFIQAIDLAKISWNVLLSEIRNAAPACKLIVWPHEFYRQENDSVLQIFANALGTPMPKRIAGFPNTVTMSEVGSKILVAAKSAGVKKGKDWNAIYKLIRDVFSIQSGFKKPPLFTAEMKTELHSRYCEDMENFLKSNIYDLTPVGFDCLKKEKLTPPK